MTARTADKPFAVRRLLLGAAFAASLAVGGLAGPAAVSARQDADAQEDSGDHGSDHGGRHSHGLRAQMERMLTIAQATPEQKTKIQAILKSAFEQAAPLRKKAADTHRELGRLLTAAKIDRAAIEKARADHVAATDQSGRILVKAFADAAEVLTPEQRARIAAAMAAEPRRGKHL
jgi:protein CpxP